MKKSEIIIVITIVVLAIAAIVIGINAFGDTEIGISDFFRNIPTEVEYFDVEEKYVKQVTDSRGLVIKEEKYSLEDDKKLSSSTFTYDTNGNLLEIETRVESEAFSFEMYDNYKSETILNAYYEYDENNNNIKYIQTTSSVTRGPEGVLSEHTYVIANAEYQYDENNHITKTISYDVSGGRLSNAISYYQLHKCYENGNIAESHLYIHGKELTSIDKYKYDENGNKIRCDSYFPEEELKSYTIYEYDEEGNLIYETLFDEDGYKLLHNEYNEYGDMIKKTTYQDKG